MKSTERFKETIKSYLDNRASSDALFFPVYNKSDKNIDNCITYILNTVQKSDCNGFTDDEIYSMAVHYYQEDNIDVGKDIDLTVVVNHKVELTAEELKKAKDDAIAKAEREQYTKITHKPKVKSECNKTIQQSLF